MIDRINTTRSGHIVTIEDPIEFLHRDKVAFVTQREVDVDTRSFAEALRGALRQDPDVILVGEMRDLETISTALTAAETGHLVLSTLHTLDATETIMRIVSSFPSHQQKSVRIQLAGILKAVISMRLVRARQRFGTRAGSRSDGFDGTDSRLHRQRRQDFPDSRSDREWRVAIQHADIRSVAVPVASGARDHLRRGDSQRDQCGRVQDARVGNLLNRSNHDGKLERDELLRATAGRVRANREPIATTAFQLEGLMQAM